MLLHLDDVASYSPEQLRQLVENKKMTRRGATWTKAKLKTLMGQYQESDYNAASLLPHVETAIERAQHMDTSPADRWPQQIGTRVYLLAQSIMDKNK